MNEFKLTERQKRFAADNHDILEDFLKYRNLPLDDFYDVVVFRFLLAVKQYDEREELRQYTFKTIAKHHMSSALSNYFKKRKRQNSNVTFISLDYPISYGANLTLGDIIADERVDVCDTVCRKLSREDHRLSDISHSGSSLRIAA